MQVNVIPSLAEAYVNLRIHSAHSLQEVHQLLSNGSVEWHAMKMKMLNKMFHFFFLIQVIDQIHSTVADQRVKIELVEGFDPLPISSTDEKAFGFQIIKKTVLDLFPSVTIAPGRIKEDAAFLAFLQNVFLDLLFPINCKMSGIYFFSSYITVLPHTLLVGCYRSL